VKNRNSHHCAFHYTTKTRVFRIAVDLLEKFTGKGVIAPDSEEGRVITPEFTSPVKGAKIKPASIYFRKNIKNQWFWQTFMLFFFWQ
jgi:hypothetical protein